MLCNIRQHFINNNHVSTLWVHAGSGHVLQVRANLLPDTELVYQGVKPSAATHLNKHLIKGFPDALISIEAHYADMGSFMQNRSLYSGRAPHFCADNVYVAVLDQGADCRWVNIRIYRAPDRLRKVIEHSDNSDTIPGCLVVSQNTVNNSVYFVSAKNFLWWVL